MRSTRCNLIFAIPILSECKRISMQQQLTPLHVLTRAGYKILCKFQRAKSHIVQKLWKCFYTKPLNINIFIIIPSIKCSFYIHNACEFIIVDVIFKRKCTRCNNSFTFQTMYHNICVQNRVNKYDTHF